MVEQTPASSSPGTSSAVIEQYARMQSQMSDSFTDYAEGLKKAAGGAGAIAGGAMQQAKGQIEVNNSNFEALVKKQADDAAAAAAVGMTPGMPSDLVASTLLEYQNTEKQLNDQGNMIRAKQGGSFSDDPLQWLTDQLSLPFDISAYNTGVAQQDRRTEFLGKLSKTFDDQARANAVVDVNTSTSLLHGMNQIALGKAAEAAGQSAMALANLGISVANMRVASTREAFTGMLNINTMLGQEQDRAFRQGPGFDMELRKEAQAKQESDVRLELDKFRSTELARQEEGRKLRQDRLDKVTTSLNLPPMSLTEYDADPNIQKKLGEFMIAPDIQSGYLGYTQVEAVNKYSSFPLSPGARFTMNWMQNKLNAFSATDAQSLSSLKPEEKMAKQEEALYKQAAAERASIPVSGGLYSPPNLRGWLSARGLYDSDGKPRFAIMTDLITLARANPEASTDPNLLLQIAVKRINEGTMTADQASQEISTIFQSIGLDNNSNRQYGRLHVPLQTPGTIKLPGIAGSVTGFNMAVQSIGGFGGGSIVDMMNPSAVSNALLRLKLRSDANSSLDPLRAVPGVP